jgi:outer membrane lipoprotein-sorting protein
MSGTRAVVCLLAVFLGAVAAAAAPGITADTILARARGAWLGSTFTAAMTMHIVRPDATRVMRIELWAAGDEKALLRVLAPKDDAGQGFLRIGADLWLYVPQTRRAVRLPPSSLGDSFLGSDLSIEDITRGVLASHYAPTLVGTESLSGVESYVLDLRPKAGAPVVYGRLRIWVRTSNFALLRVDYVDQREDVIRRMLLHGTRLVNGQLVAPQITVENVLRPGERTTIRLDRFAVDTPIPPTVFTLEFLTGG